MDEKKRKKQANGMTSSFQKTWQGVSAQNSVKSWMNTAKKSAVVLYFVTNVWYNRKKGKT